MNFKHLVETQLLQSSSCNESGMYDDFAGEVLRLHYEAADLRELFLQLIYAEVELSEALHLQPDNQHLIKASRLVQKVLQYLQQESLTVKEKHQNGEPTTTYKWSAKKAHLVELVYALVGCKSINNGDIKIKDFATDLGAFLGVDIRDAHDTYSSTIKRRSSDERAYYLKRLTFFLINKMNREDDIPTPKHIAYYPKTLFDEE